MSLSAWHSARGNDKKDLKVVVKVDGQKADDTKVPIELWDKMFALTWATNLPGVGLPRGWRQALGSLRKGFTVWWKRQVLRS